MRAAIVFTVLTVGAGTAHAEGSYLEGVLGLAIPVAGDENYEELDEALKIGVRAGGGSGPTAIELSADYTRFQQIEVGIGVGTLRYDPDRYRVMIGGRHRIAVGGGKRGSTAFVRAGVGADFARVTGSYDGLGGSAENSETDVGLAAEVGGGFVVSLGGLYLGGQVAVPMAFHFDEDDPDDDEDFDLEYSAFDVDVLFTIGASF